MSQKGTPFSKNGNRKSFHVAGKSLGAAAHSNEKKVLSGRFPHLKPNFLFIYLFLTSKVLLNDSYDILLQ